MLGVEQVAQVTNNRIVAQQPGSHWRQWRARFGWKGIVFHLIIFFFFANMVIVGAQSIGTIGQPWTGLYFNYYFKVLGADPPSTELAPQRDPHVLRRDIIVLIDGQSPLNTEPVLRAKFAAGAKEITYLVKRGSGNSATELAVTSRLRTFEWADYLALFGIGTLVGWLFFITGLGIYYLRPQERLNQVFMLTMINAAAYLVVGYEGVYVYRPNPLDLNWFEQLGCVLLCLLGATTFQLAANFPAVKPLVRRRPWVQYILYPIAAVVALIVVIAVGRKISSVILHRDFDASLAFFGADYGLAGFGTAALLAGIIYDAVSSREPTVRRQGRIVLAGGLLGVGPLLFFYLIPTTFVGRALIEFNLGYAFLLFFPLSVAYAIIRYKLFDFNFLLRRTIAYVIASLVFAFGYLVFVGLLQAAFSGITGRSTILANILSTVGIVVLFSPVYNRFRRLVERYFFRERYVFRHAMLDFSRQVRDIYDQDELGNRLVREVTAIMDLQGAALYLDVADGSHSLHLSHVASSRDVGANQRSQLISYDESEERAEQWREGLPLGTEVRAWLLSYNRPLNMATLPDTIPSDGAPLLAYCLAEKIAMFIPLVVEGRLVGLLLLRRKRSGARVLREDIDLLTALLPQVTLALRNAQLLAEATGRQRVVTEMEIAREIQLGLFPRHIRQPVGYAIRATCLPAREASGDIYDVVEIGERLALIVADACGKGVPAAMMMGLARNTVRSELGYYTDPAPTLTAANRWLNYDLGDRSFVALTYMLLDPIHHLITLSNAGGLSPILYRAGVCSYLGTTGPSLPLGIIPDIDYQQVEVALQPDDLVICYTDGLVEAINKAEELYSFERLEAAICAWDGQGEAEGLISYLINEVNQFSEGVAQADDITIMVISYAPVAATIPQLGSQPASPHLLPVG